MSRLIIPQNGMRVDYHYEAKQEQPWAAIIIWVQNPRLVDLMIFTAKGATSTASGVALLQEGDHAPTNGGDWCTWPKEPQVFFSEEQVMTPNGPVEVIG